MSDLREIAFDTVTTSLKWDQDDRIIELGAVELVNHVPTGRTFQAYVNPGRPVSEATIRITGITDADLQDQPPFEHPDIVDAFLGFVDGATLVAHNASFDRGFLNMELERCGRPAIPDDHWVDTVMMARQRYPGAPASLDALCKRFEINSEARTFHGALLDSQLLAEVYLELLGGRVRAFDFGETSGPATGGDHRAAQRSAGRPEMLTEAERQAHAEFVASLGGQPLWSRYA